jgi:hypothetical protein
VAFSWYFDRGCFPRGETTVHYRIESGSGIAGRGNAWNVTELPSGPTLGPKVTTRSALRSQILEAIAEGAKPEARDGFEVYARWHTYGSTSSVQWFTRRKRVHAIRSAG